MNLQLKETVSTNATQYEMKHGSVNLIKRCLSALNLLLVSKGVITEDELRSAVNDEILQEEASLSDEAQADGETTENKMFEAIQLSIAEREENSRKMAHNLTASVEDLQPYSNNALLRMIDSMKNVASPQDGEVLCGTAAVLEEEKKRMATVDNEQDQKLINATFTHPDLGVGFYVESVHNGIAVMKRNEVVFVKDLLEKWSRDTEFDGIIEDTFHKFKPAQPE